MIWESKKPVFLYGAAHRGTIVARYLKKICNLVGFVDLRADEIITCEGYPVFEIDDIDKNCIVVVCINNIFDHENIAQYLVGKGVSGVIFSPVDGSNMDWRSIEERQNMKNIYSSILEECLDLPVSIPEVNGLLCMKIQDEAIIDQDEHEVLSWIPSTLAYTRLSGNGVFQDTPVLTLFPYLEIFRFFSGEDEASQDYYIDLYCSAAAEQFNVSTTTRWVENVLRSRRHVYERMRLAESLDPLFFVRLAVKASWNEAGSHFNMDSGKHRAAFLVHRGRAFIPLKISRSDYERYLNIPVVNYIYSFLRENRISELPYPINHPFFYKFPYDPRGSFYDNLLKITRKMVIKDFELNKKVSLLGKEINVYRGCLEPLAQALAQLGCIIYYSYNESEIDRRIRVLYGVSSRFIYVKRDEISKKDVLDFWVDSL